MANGPDTRCSETTEGERLDLLLVFPPQWTPQNPHFALTALTGHLRGRGYRVRPVDLNIDFYTEVLSREALEWARQRVHFEHAHLAAKLQLLTLVGDDSPEYKRDGRKALHLREYLAGEGDKAQAFAAVADHVADAVAILRDPKRFYDPEQFNHAMNVVERALEVYSLPYWPSRLQFNFFEHPEVQLNYEDILGYVRDEHANMFLRFYAGRVASLLEARPRVVGVSINAFSQLLPGLTLAHELMRVAPPDVHINVGGNFFTRLVDNLKARPEFFEHFCHSLSFGEGERPLIALLDAVAAGTPLTQVPNLVHPDAGAVQVNPTCQPERLEDRGFHDLSDLPLDLYLTPDFVICLEASKGCYWGRCSFCDSFFGVSRDEATVDRVVAEMRHLKERWGVRHFEFADECMTPQFMERLSDRLIAEALDVRWLCNGRLERTFTRERLQRYFDAGLRVVLWGFESGARRIMDLINKGVDFEGRWQVLRDASEVGIWNNAYIFFGFPTETEAEADQTIVAICDHTDLIHSYGRSVFTLGKQSLLREDAARYGIVSMVEDDQEFSTNLSFKSTGGLSEEASYLKMRQCTTRAAKAYGGKPLWMFLRYREDLHLYVCRHGRDFVRRYQVGEENLTEFEFVW